MASLTPLQIGIYATLFVIFLGVPMLSQQFGAMLDSIPLRFAAALAILAALTYDKMVALALFIVLCALYVQRHTDSVKSILGPQGSLNPREFAMPRSSEGPSAMEGLQKGGYTDSSFDEMDFMPKDDNQSDHFERAGPSIDEKQALATEPLGSRAEAIFPQAQQGARDLMESNKGGAFEN